MPDKPKQELEFTSEEWAVIVGLISSQGGASSRISWHVSAVGPIVVLAGYGALKSDVIAVGLAFASLLAYVIWLSAGELRGLKIYQSICQKIVAFKQPQEQSPSPDTSP